MSVMTAPAIDDTAIIRLLKQTGESSFEDGMNVFRKQGMDANDARDAIWQLLSHGTIVFTPDRHLRLPEKAVVQEIAR